MPTIFRKLGFRFFFYSDEGNEAPHVHVEKGGGRGKYWIEPVKKAYMRNFKKKEEQQAEKIVQDEQETYSTLLKFRQR